MGGGIVGSGFAAFWVLLKRMDQMRTELKAEIADSETRLRQEIAASETRRKEDTAMIRNDIVSIREDIKELRSSVINLGQRVARVEALLIKDFATELAIDPTQVASEPEYRAGVSEPKPDGAT